MEKVMSVEEKIRRAEEIYERKRKGENRTVAKVPVNDEKKDIKLLKRMFIQVLVCVSIYLIIYTINNNQYVFSDDFINKVNEILSYDTNFMELYYNVQDSIKQLVQKNEEVSPENSIGGAEEKTENSETTNEQAITQESQIQDDSQIEQNDEQVNSINETINEQVNSQADDEVNVQNLSQEEQDIIAIKNTTSFIKPIEGIISSRFGIRETATGTVPKNHTGTDIAANLGTKIKSATDGEVVLASSVGDYRKAFKNSNR